MSDSPPSHSCLSEDELLQLLEPSVANIDWDRFEQHLATCTTCRDRLESLSGSLPAQFEESTGDTDSEALTQAIADLCSIRPTWDAKSKYGFLGPSADASNIGTLGKYEIQRVIGQGGMGVVFAAFDPDLRRDIAIKVPTPSLVADQTFYERFLREARAIASVRHDNIVTVFAVEEANQTPFMVMERISGRSLDQEIRARQRLPFEEVARIAQESAAALQTAHASGLVHRDIKPANILLEAENGRVKVTDFGLAKSDHEDIRLTATGTLAGTPEFMAPEQVTEDEVTAQSDLFSLGVVLYAALTGGSPFRGKNALSTMQRVCTETPASVVATNANIPEWFDTLLQRLMSKDASKRPQSATEVLDAIRNQTTLVTASVNAQGQVNRTAVAVKIGLTVVAAGVIALAGYFWPRGNAAEDALPQETVHHAEPGFIIQGQSYADLGEAISAAVDGDAIEVTGNGPFAVPGFHVGAKSISIRATTGSKPVFTVGATDAVANIPFLRSTANLTLQGLEVRWQMQPTTSSTITNAADLCMISTDGDLRISKCRLVAASMTGCLGNSGVTVEAESSYLIAERGPCIAWDPDGDARAKLTNSVFEGHVALMCNTVRNSNQRRNVSIELTNNTFVTSRGIQLARPRSRVKVVVTRNVFDVSDVLVVTDSRQKMMQIVDRPDVVRLLKTCVEWSESQNAFARSTNLFSRSMDRMNRPTRPEVDSLADWHSIWGADSGSVEADFEFETIESDFGRQNQLVSIRKNSTETIEGIGADPATVGP